MTVLGIASDELWAGAEKQLKILPAKLRSFIGTIVAAVIFNSGRLSNELAQVGVEVLKLDESQASSIELLLRTKSFIDGFQPNNGLR